MLFVIFAQDADDALPKRAAHYDAHKDFLARAADYGVEIIMSGPLVQDDGDTRCGSLIVVDAKDRGTVENFHHADPFMTNGIWQCSTTRAFLRAR